MPHGWVRSRRMLSEEVIPVKIGLTQSNLHMLDEWLHDVSHPSSPNYGKHWEPSKIAETFAPSHETVDAVTEWLANSGISSDRVSRSQSLGWLQFNATIEETEHLLKTEYHVYKHKTGKAHVACEEYHLPAHIQKHVDFITPTVHFDAKIDRDPTDLRRRSKTKRDDTTAQQKKRDEKLVKRSPSTTAAVGTPVESGAVQKIGLPSSGSLPKPGDVVNIIEAELATCDEYITPDCLRALYDIPINAITAPGNSYGIVEYTPQAYIPTDLDLFFANYSPKSVGDRPIFDAIDGGFLQTEYVDFDYNGESDLDLEYGMTLVYPQNVTLYQVGDITGDETFNTFLDALDASYCTFEGGDDPTVDPQYPVAPYGYQGPNQCGGFAATKVISTSYAYNEADLTPFYEMRQCQEYAKLGLAGTTFLYSSGDYGVAGNSDECIDPVTREYNNGTYGIFNPSFPGTCPYITSVGATQIVPGASVTPPEEASETVIYSGGGFSNVFPLPAYQEEAVHTWWTEHPPPYGADRFNNSQRTRGIPDVAANGANYVVAVDNEFLLVYGTSCASPVFGSILTLINQERLLAGKSSIGFINPTLYAHSSVLNDITLGDNPGCGTDGFNATTGWDPVTGLGTPNYERMLALFLSLP